MMVTKIGKKKIQNLFLLNPVTNLQSALLNDSNTSHVQNRGQISLLHFTKYTIIFKKQKLVMIFIF